MRESTKHRYVWLFLLAIAVPSIALAWIGARLIRQEQELEQRRRFDEQRRVVSEVRGVLLRRLEGFKLQEVSSLTSREFAPSSEQLNPAVVLSGLVDNERLVLPWEIASRLPGMSPDTDNPPFDELMARGSAAEFSEGDAAAAARLYGEALAAAQDTGQETRARFLLARTLGKAGRDQASMDAYRTLLRSDTRTADESGVPFALYAVRQLLNAGVADTGMAELIEAELERGLLVAPSELYLLRVLATSLADVATDAALRSRAGRLVGVIELRNVMAEQAMVLQREFPRLGLMPPSTGNGQSAEPSWLSWGDSWLVSVSPLSGAIEGVLVAVQRDDVLEAVEREVVTNGAGESFEIVNASDSASQSLLPNFPGLSVRFASQGSATGPASLRRAFLLVALVLVLSVTLMGGYLLWRDVRREVNVAELRSEFVSAVSHELKTPLTSIRMFAETLQMHGTESIHERTGSSLFPGTIRFGPIRSSPTAAWGLISSLSSCLPMESRQTTPGMATSVPTISRTSRFSHRPKVTGPARPSAGPSTALQIRASSSSCSQMMPRIHRVSVRDRHFWMWSRSLRTQRATLASA